MKVYIYAYILVAMYSCSINQSIPDKDKEEILTLLSQLNELFIPEEEIIIKNSRTDEWIFYNGSGTIAKDSNRKAILSRKIKLLSDNKLTTKRYLDQVFHSLSEEDNINLGIILTRNFFGDMMIKTFPERRDIHREYCDDWIGDEDILAMSDSSFRKFIKSRITSTKKNNSVLTLPYAEISVAICEQVERENFQYEFYFVKTSEDKWFIDDIKIVEKRK